MNKKVTVTYNGNNIIDNVELANSTTTYNGSIIIEDFTGTKTLICSGKFLSTDITIADKTLKCGGAIAESNIVISSENAIISVGPKPTNLTPSVYYTGTERTNGYTKPENVSMTGDDRGINIGTYVANYTPNSGYCWDDLTVDTVTITLTIKARESWDTNPGSKTALSLDFNWTEA